MSNLLSNLSFSEIIILIGILSIGLELFINLDTGFDLVLLGLALVLGGGTGLIFNSAILAIIISILFCLSYIFFGRKIIKQKLFIATNSTNIDKLVDQQGIVVRTITPDTCGLIRLDDEDWRATSDDVIYEQAKVKVISIEGVTLKVKKI